jgi:SAM-dependent methyltransferase
MILRIFAKSPVRAYLRLNASLWSHLRPSITGLRVVRSYGVLLHALARRHSVRRQSLGTFFFRNRPELVLMRRLCASEPTGGTVRLCVLACSLGVEVYSIMWTLRSARPDLKILAHAVDISKEALRFAQNGVYRLGQGELQDASIFERMSEEEMQAMFIRDGDELRIAPALTDVTWHLGDASDPAIYDLLGPQDIVVGNRFLCHMDPPTAERCLRNVGRLVAPGGYLFVSGVDLDVRTKVARELGWNPQQDLIEAIHDGDASLRDPWPCDYTGLEPLNKRRSDWRIRYASVFKLGDEQ